MNEKEYELWNNRCALLRYALQRIITILALEDGSLREEVENVMDICAKAIMADNADCERIENERRLKDEGGAE